MKIKKNDQVYILSGKDRGKKGKVIQSFPAEGKVVVDGVNKTYKHMKGRRGGEAGQKIEFFGPVAVSNVKLVCPACSKPARVGYQVKDKRKERICRKCQAVITAKKAEEPKKKK